MRIAHAPRAQVAVLHLAVLFISVSCRVPNNSSFAPERFRHSRNPNIQWSQNLSLREKQLYIMQQSAGGGGGGGGSDDVTCCPSVLEMTEPEGGTNEKGVLVKLYRDSTNHQRFYEISCATGVENRECRFLDKKLANQSRCVQQFSYSYALLEDSSLQPDHMESSGDPGASSFPIMGMTSGRTRWMLGYIKVRSGCACTLAPKKAKKTKPSSKAKKRLHHDDGLT